MATALVLGPETVEAIRKVRAFAEDPKWWRRLGTDEVMFLPGDIEAYTALIQIGYKAVYSIDTDGELITKHLSVSRCNTVGEPRGIHPVAMKELTKLFGFGEDALLGTMPTDEPWVVHALEPFKAT